MDVPCDSGARALAQVHPDVKAGRSVNYPQVALAIPRQQNHFFERARRRCLKVCNVLVRHHHHVAGGIRIKIQNDVVVFSTENHQVFGIVPALGFLTENATLGRVRPLDVLIAPRAPELVHNWIRAGIYGVGGEPPDPSGDGVAAACAAPLEVLTRSFNSLLGLKYGIRLDGTSTRVPVLGLRPTRGCLCRVRKLPNPRISMLSPPRRERRMLSNIASTITSQSFLVISTTRETSSIRSAFVMFHPSSISRK